MKKLLPGPAGRVLLAGALATGAIAFGPFSSGARAADGNGTEASAPARAPGANAAHPADCAARSTDAPPAVLPASAALARAQVALTLRLVSAREGGPSAVSPSGIAAVLGALDLGADPAMHGAIVRTLQLNGRRGRTVAHAESLRRALRLLAAAPSDATLSSASALFVDGREALKPGIAERFMAEARMPVRSADLSGAAGVAEVNGFVAEATRGHIPEILGQADAGPALVAVNAFHFSGCWRVPFDPAFTLPAAFTRLDGSTVDVATMTLDGSTLSHRIEGRFAAVDLVYSDARYSLVLVTTTDRPAAAGDFWPARRLLQGGGFSEAPVDLELPRFRIDAEADLLPALAGIGLRAGLKSPTALAGIAPGLRLGTLRQKSVLMVDERGTQASAATAAVATRSAAARPLAIAFNKPFVFALRHRPTGLILLAGYVADPS